MKVKVAFLCLMFFMISCTTETDKSKANNTNSFVVSPLNIDTNTIVTEVLNIEFLTDKEQIKTIKDNYKRITAITDWANVIKVPFYNESTEGGEIIKYYKDEKLEILTVDIYGEMGRIHSEYYLIEEHLSFVFRQEYNYLEPVYVEGFDESESEIIENRYYFNNDTLIQEIAPTGDPILYNKPYFDEVTKQYLTNFNRYNKLSNE